jgi:uncharacterized protein (DUF58 family)
VPLREFWLLFGVGLTLIGLAAGSTIVTATGLVILTVGGIAKYWSTHLFDRVTLTRSLRERRVFVDEPVTFHVELENRKLLPLPWYEWRIAVADHTTAEGELLAASASPGVSFLRRRGAIGWYEKQSWDFQLAIDERGYHQYGGATITSADLLGVFPRQHTDRDLDHLVVFPRVYSLQDLGIDAERPFGEMRGRIRVYEDPLRISGLRDYRPGDSLRRVDWKATARRGDLTSRIYDPAASRQIYIMVNIDTLTHVWEGYLKEELERTVSTAASVAVWAAGQRHAVGLLANGSFPEADRPIRLPPSSSREQVTRILEALAMVQPLTLNTLAGTIQREAGKIPIGSTIVVVASLVPDNLAGALLRLQDEGHRVFLLATSDRIDATTLHGIPLQSVVRAFDRLEPVDPKEVGR